MIRLITIGVLIVIAFLLIRYGVGEKAQKGIVVTLVAGLIIYTVSVVVTELIR